jgi:hypothetical protein
MLHQNRKLIGALCALLCYSLFHLAAHANEMGMTWKKQSHYDTLGVDRVGCNGCDAYHGDTACSTRLPILCLKKDNSPDPGVPILPCNGCSQPDDFYNGWAEGHIGLTLPVPGEALMGVEDANDICRFFVGSDYRIGEHHDGKRQSGGYGGWNWYAYGNVNDPSRFWAHVNGQPANCWGNGEGVHSERTDAEILALVSPDIRLVNISTRAVIQGGHEDVIAGFIIKGTGKQMVLIRALGEGLGLSPGVDARLTLTTLTGHPITTNENWVNWVPPSIWNDQSWASMPIILENWQPPHVSDAALLVDLPAGAYTAIMSSSAAKGIGLVEANAIPVKKIGTLPFYLILRYLNEALPEIKEDTQEIKDRLKNYRVNILNYTTPTKTLKSGNQFSISSTNQDTFDQVLSESLKLARPLLPFLDCDDQNPCPLGDIDELFTVNHLGELIPISGPAYEDFLEQYTGYFENIDGVSVIEDNEVPDIEQPFTLSNSPVSSKTQKVVNIDLPDDVTLDLHNTSGTGQEDITIGRIRVLPYPDTDTSLPVTSQKASLTPSSTKRLARQKTWAEFSGSQFNEKLVYIRISIQYSRSTFYVWWQFR